MYRPRIEFLEKRQMFAADNLSDVVAAHVLGNCPNWFVDPNPPPFVSEGPSSFTADSSADVFDGKIDDGEFSTQSRISKMHLEDISMGIVSIGAPLGFSFGDLDVGAKLIGGSGLFDNTPMDEVVLTNVAGDATVVQGFLLPYIEQDNLYKLTDIADGTSNTMMLATRAGGEVVSDLLVPETDGTQGIIAILIGLTADPSDPSDADGSAASIDTWEHANMDRQGPATNGIIAVLIGLMVDPSDPSGNTNAVANFAFADGSVRFLTTDGNGTSALLGADEFFARIANTTSGQPRVLQSSIELEDLLVSHIKAGGDTSAGSPITHDAEFETWANESKFDRGQQLGSFYDLLISSYNLRATGDPAARTDARTLSIASDGAFIDTLAILHEDNEFTIPRMITANGFAKAN